MRQNLSKWLEAALDHADMKQAEMARQLTIALKASYDRSAVNKMVKGGRKINADELLAASKITNFPAPEGFQRDEHIESSDIADHAAKVAPPAPSKRGSMPRPLVPFMGWAAGHEGADWIIRRDVEELLPRPAAIPSERAVFALKVLGDSMDPAYRQGTTVYVEQFGVVRPGDTVIVVVKHGPHNEDRSAYIKTLIRRTSRKVICEQYNPRKPIEFEVSDVEAIYRVIPWEELLG